MKVFRKIRQELAAQNSFAKYMRYAIGEILLVVVGILIALQVNTWNANRIQKNKETTYLNSIKRDLKEQLNSINTQLDYELNISQKAKSILEYYKQHHEFKVDSAFTATIGALSGRKTFVNNNPTYTELLSSGNLDIISNNEFKNNLIQYQQQMERMEQIINKNNNLFTDGVFTPEALKLSEVQVSAVFTQDIVKDVLSANTVSQTNNFFNLNEENLKAITVAQLQIPEKQLIMINLINFRYQLTIIHSSFLSGQKEKTHELLDKLKNIDGNLE